MACAVGSRAFDGSRHEYRHRLEEERDPRYVRGVSSPEEDELVEAEAFGRSAARRGIANEVPHWAALIETGRECIDVESSIDPRTGLPIIWTSAPANLVERQRRFIAAHNAEILRAIEAKEIDVDFRPFLTTREAVAERFRTGRVHLLAPKKPLDLPKHDVRFEVFVPRRPKTPPQFGKGGDPYVRRVDRDGRRWMLGYDEAPIRVAVSDDEETVAFDLAMVCLVFHVSTGAQLHRFQRVPASASSCES